MPNDTSPEGMARYVALLRERSPAERLRIAAALTTGVRRMAELGIRQAFPEATDEEVRARLAARIYGREVAARYFPDLPDDAR